MLREDGTSYLNVLEVKTSIKLGGQEITATPTVTATDVSFDPTGKEFAPESTNVDLALVEAINRVKTLEDAGSGTAIEGIVSWRNAINDVTTITSSQVNSNLSFFVTVAGNYRVKAILKCLMASGKNENLFLSFYKRNTPNEVPWTLIAEEVTFNQAYLTTTTESYGVENRPNYLILEEVLTLAVNDEVTVFISSETNTAATIENSQLFYEKTAMTINRHAGNFDV